MDIIKLRKQLETIHEDHRNEVTRLKEGYNIEIFKLKKELERVSREHVETHSTFQEKLASTKEKHNYSLSDVEKTYESKLSSLEQLYMSKITDVNTKNEELHRIIASLQSQLSEVENRASYMQQEIEVRKREQHNLDVHNSDLTSQLNDTRKKLKDLHEIFGSVQNVTVELSKKYDDTNVEYHRVLADNKRYELQLYDMNNMLQDAHQTLQTTTVHKDSVISKLQEQLAVAELFMHRIHTAMVQKRGEKSVIEEEIEKFNVSISSASSSLINMPLKAVPASLHTSPSKPFTYQSVIGNGHIQHVDAQQPQPYLVQQMHKPGNTMFQYQQHDQQYERHQPVTTSAFQSPQPLQKVHTPMNNFAQYQHQLAGIHTPEPLQQVHLPVNNVPQQQQQQQPPATIAIAYKPQSPPQAHLPLNNVPEQQQQQQPPATIPITHKPQSPQVQLPVNNLPEQQQEQQPPASILAAHKPQSPQVQLPVNNVQKQVKLAPNNPATDDSDEKTKEAERKRKEMEAESKRLAAEMERLKKQEEEKKMQAVREKERAKAEAEMKKQEAAMKKQQAELEKLRKQKELNEKKAELEEAMEEKLRLDTVIEEWKENFVGINGREPTSDERPPEIKEYHNRLKPLKSEIKRLNTLIFQMESD